MSGPFDGDRYVLKRKLLKILGSGFTISREGHRVLEAHQKAFRIKEDIRLKGTDGRELLGIHARSIIDFSAAYDVIDIPTGTRLGTFRRKGFHSLVRGIPGSFWTPRARPTARCSKTASRSASCAAS